MLSQSNNRVQAIKSKFESLNSDELLSKQKPQLIKQDSRNSNNVQKPSDCLRNYESETVQSVINQKNQKKNQQENDSDISDDESAPVPNSSYLYTKLTTPLNICDTNKLTLTRQSSDPSKKLQRSHAFRCDKTVKIPSPQRHGSCNSKTDVNMNQPKLSQDRLKKLGNLLEDRMKKENFVIKTTNEEIPMEIHSDSNIILNSIPDSDVPKHILDQYAKVLKPKKPESPIDQHHEIMTDSGVSSETENIEETDKSNRIKLIKAQFETVSKTEVPKKDEFKLDVDVKLNKTNLEILNGHELCSSTETMRLERKNPHIDLTSTLKKALKQPLPMGPPPKKPPRTFQMSPPPQDFRKNESQRKDAKIMLEKLEQVLLKREKSSNSSTLTDDSRVSLTKNKEKSKEMHYLCTEILDITHRTLLPNTHQVSESITNCLTSLNCAVIPSKSTTSLPYTRLSSDQPTNTFCYSCTHLENPKEQRFSTFLSTKLTDNLCQKCSMNLAKTHSFTCHLNCECKKSEFFVQNEQEHIYDIPNTEDSFNIGKFEGKSIHRHGCVMDSCVNDTVDGGTLNCGEKRYGTILSRNSQSKSLEDLRDKIQNEKIYDIPCDRSRTPSPELRNSRKSDFESLRLSFENGFQNKITRTTTNLSPTKPTIVKPSPTNLVGSKSTDDLCSKDKQTKRNGVSLGRKDQLDCDRENLNRLMNEIYETVSAACRMDDKQKPSKFPTDHSDGTSSEDSVALTRSLTEKRKRYVRRVSSRVGCLDANKTQKRYRAQTSVCSFKSENLSVNPYSTFRTWKSFRHSVKNLNKSMDNCDSKTNLTDSKWNLVAVKPVVSEDELSLDEKAGCMEIHLPYEPKQRAIFDLCLLVGINYMTGQAYVKSVFPNQVSIPPHIENLVFPETLSKDSQAKLNYDLDSARTQCYSLVLTNEKGERNFGYCRRVLPEGANVCLPLCYCIIGRYRAPGFYYKVLQEVESHHGSSDVEIQCVLQQLIETDFPNPGEDVQIKMEKKCDFSKSNFRNSVNLGDIFKSKSLSERKLNIEDTHHTLPGFYDLENNNNRRVVTKNERNLKIIKRPIEPRVDEDNLSVLLDSLGPSLMLKIFGSLLLERKVVFISDKLSQLSSCMEGLQAILYPFVWQQPLISTIPSELKKDILEAPLPILAGMLKSSNSPEMWEKDLEGIQFEEGMLIDISHPSPKIIFNQGDESSIIPNSFHKTLKATLQMESKNTQKDREDEKTRNVMISEAFLRYFVDILSNFWDFFSIGVLKDGDLGRGDVVFAKDNFVKSASSKQNQYFLEWFTETAMFNHFIQNMAASYPTRQQVAPLPIDYSTIDIVDAPLPNFYELFDDRITRKLNSKKTAKSEQKIESSGKNNYKSAMNRRVRILKSKLKELVS